MLPGEINRSPKQKDRKRCSCRRHEERFLREKSTNRERQLAPLREEDLFPAARCKLAPRVQRTRPNVCELLAVTRADVRPPFGKMLGKFAERTPSAPALSSHVSLPLSLSLRWKINRTFQRSFENPVIIVPDLCRLLAFWKLFPRENWIRNREIRNFAIAVRRILNEKKRKLPFWERNSFPFLLLPV